MGRNIGYERVRGEDLPAEYLVYQAQDSLLVRAAVATAILTQGMWGDGEGHSHLVEIMNCGVERALVNALDAIDTTKNKTNEELIDLLREFLLLPALPDEAVFVARRRLKIAMDRRFSKLHDLSTLSDVGLDNIERFMALS